jgi:hypothetical protein
MMKTTSTPLTPKNQQLASITLSQYKLLMRLLIVVLHSIIIIRNALHRTIVPIATLGKDVQGDKDSGQHLLNQSFLKNKVILRGVAPSAIMWKERNKKNCQNKTLKSVSYLSSFRSWNKEMYKKSMFLIRDLMQERDRLNNLLQK